MAYLNQKINVQQNQIAQISKVEELFEQRRIPRFKLGSRSGAAPVDYKAIRVLFRVSCDVARRGICCCFIVRRGICVHGICQFRRLLQTVSARVHKSDSGEKFAARFSNYSIFMDCQRNEKNSRTTKNSISIRCQGRTSGASAIGSIRRQSATAVHRRFVRQSSNCWGRCCWI